MSHFGSHFVFAYILNCSTLTKFQFSVWSPAMPKKTESLKKKRNTSKRGIVQWLPDWQKAKNQGWQNTTAVQLLIGEKTLQIYSLF